MLTKRTKDNNVLSHRCRKLANEMKSMGVSGILPPQHEIMADRFGWRDAEDRRMISAAILAFEMALPTEDPGTRNILGPDRDEQWARNLFERAVGGFYEVVLNSQGWVVNTGTILKWPIEQPSTNIVDVLPNMITDITLEKEDKRRIVIDTKFTSLLVQGHYRDKSIQSKYLYQMYSYLRTQEQEGDDLSNKAEGILLHPSVGYDYDETVHIQKHLIRFKTVDLTKPSEDIRKSLLSIL